MRGKTRNRFWAVAIVMLTAAVASGKAGNSVAGSFNIPDVNGGLVSLSNYPEAKGFIIVFTCNHCPFAKLYPERLNKLWQLYAAKGVPLLAISSTDTVSYEEDTYAHMREKARKEHFLFPYLYDGSQTVASEFAAQKTPHAFVLWRENGQYVIKYSGAIDDNGAHADAVKKPYVALAVDALLAGKAVAEPETKSIGCQIHFRKK